MSKYLVTDEEQVECPYCKRACEILNNNHLKTHNKTLEDLYQEFGGYSTCTKKYIEKTNLNRRIKIQEKYGQNITNISQIENIKNKISIGILGSKKIAIKKRRKTIEKILQKDPNYFKNINEKNRKTKLERYGNENYNNIEKSKQTKLERYENENYTNRDKTNKTNLEKYGGKSPICNSQIANKISETQNKKMIPKVLQFIKEVGFILEGDYINAHYKHNLKCSKCETVFEKSWNEIQQGYTCPICNPRYVNSKSIAHKEIEEFISSLGIEIISNNREIIKPFELDIVSLKDKIAIEYCGVAFHHEEILTETRKISGNYYHQFKLDECLKKGFRLITIFEDEWFFKKDIVKDRLKQIFKKFDGQRIHGRNCIIKEIDSNIKNKFLDEFHIQGSDSSIIKLGAFHKDELISVMTFSHGNISKGSISNKDIWELNRFCSNPKYHIPGISSKLLENFKRNFKWKVIFSYSDRRWFDGNMYYSLGFSFDKFTKPNYWYINLNKGCKRIHRFTLRKQKNEPKDIPEWVLRRNEGYLRIWDCGHQKFIMKNE